MNSMELLPSEYLCGNWTVSMDIRTIINTTYCIIKTYKLHIIGSNQNLQL